MSTSPHHDLSKRERQIMDIVHRLGEAAVAEVHERMADAPSYNAVRVTMANLEEKGYLRHLRDGRRYVYRPVQRLRRTRSTAAKHMLSTFFGDSVPEAVSTLLDVKTSCLTDADFDALEALIEEARSKREAEE